MGVGDALMARRKDHQRRPNQGPGGAGSQLDAEGVDGVGQGQGRVEVSIGAHQAQLYRFIAAGVEEHQLGSGVAHPRVVEPPGDVHDAALEKTGEHVLRRAATID